MWVYNNIRVFVQEFTGTGDQSIARLQPIEGGTVLQTFGYENEIHKIAGVIVGETDKNALLNLRTTGLTYTLSGYGTNYGSYYLKNISWSRIPTIAQTIRSDLDCTAPVFTVELELYK